MNLEIAILYVLILAIIFFGIVVFLNNHRASLNKIFFTLSLGLVIWTFGMIRYIRNPFEFSDVLIWSKILHFAGSIITSLLFLFALELVSKSKKYYFYILLVPLLALFYYFFINPQIIVGINDIPGNRQLVYGTAYWLYATHFFLLLATFFVILVKGYLGARANIKSQIGIVLLGFIIPGVASSIINLILPMTGNFQIAWTGPIFLFFLLAFLGYAITKHSLFNIKILATEVFVGLLNFVMLVWALTNQSVFPYIILVSSAVLGTLIVRSVHNEHNQRKQLEILTEQLQSANSKLKQVDAMKTEFISMASHELLTPISAIEGYLSMMLDEHMVKIEDPKARQYMESVYKSSKRLARLVADLLNVSRIEQGRMLVTKEETDIKTLVDEVIKELKFKAEEKHHEMVAQIRDGINTKIYADEDKIKEVIINLTGNSIKYTKEGGKIGIGVDIWPTGEVEKRFGKMQAELKEHAKTSEGALQSIVNDKFSQLVGDKQMVILVKDTGIGITHEDIGHLFQKFSRVGDWSTQEVQGTGLGLYISRALVEMHHGRIWVESEGEGKGSTFYFSLPTIEAEAEEKKLDAEVPVAKDAKPLAKPAAAPSQ